VYLSDEKFQQPKLTNKLAQLRARSHAHSPWCNLAILSTREDAAWDSKSVERMSECHYNHIA